MWKKLIERFRKLDTVEKKSFWAVAPIASVVGILSIFFSASSFSTEFYLIMGLLCAAFPIIMMAWCYRSKNYHTCYMVLVIGIGGFLIPAAFLTNGGFNSGMPIFCMAGTILGAFCYERKHRIIAFSVSMLLTLSAFLLCDRMGTLNAVNKEWVQNDIVVSYIMVSIGLFLIINMLLIQTKNYQTDAAVLSGYVDSNVKEQLVRQAKQGQSSLKGTRGKVTVLFADVSRFTTTTERMNPEDAASYLNTFLTIADECIHANGGVLDKYIGDCAMAYWPDPSETGEGILSAVRAVMDMRDRIYDASEEIFAKFKTEMNFSAGIEYGEVVLGNIGSQNRKDYTIIGDAVNTASRLEGKASPGELIVSENIVNKVGDQLELSDEVHECSLKGKNKNVNLYTVLGIKDPEPDVMGILFEQAKKMPFRKKVEGEAEDDSRYKFYVCGCRGSLPVSGLRFSEFGGETSCYVLRKGDYAVVLDTGTGLLNAEPVLRGCKKIDILFTHVHYDHILGLLNLSVFPKDAKIKLYGHFGSWAGEGTIRSFLDSPYWPVPLPDVPITDVILAREYRLTDEIVATFYRTFHPDNGCVIKLMVGKDKICLYSDLEDPSYMDPDIARCSDLLLYDGMFDRRDPETHKGWGHSTWQDGVEYAKAENVRKVLITHHDPKAGDHELREREQMAKEIFERSAFARSGDVFVL